jgi:hypothetical protein
LAVAGHRDPRARDRGAPREFDDGHMNIGYRYDTSIPLLVDAIVRDA